MALWLMALRTCRRPGRIKAFLHMQHLTVLGATAPRMPETQGLKVVTSRVWFDTCLSCHVTSMSTETVNLPRCVYADTLILCLTGLHATQRHNDLQPLTAVASQAKPGRAPRGKSGFGESPGLELCPKIPGMNAYTHRVHMEFD